MRDDIIIRPETHADYADIVRLVLRSFKEGTDYSDGTDVLALIEEIRDSGYRLPELSFVATYREQVVGHFMFSRFPLSRAFEGGGYADAPAGGIVMLAPVSVHADFFGHGVGTAMLTQGIERARAAGYAGVTVEGNYKFYNRLGFRTSAEFGIFPTSGIPILEPRCMMCMELSPGALAGKSGYVVYDMYHNA